MKDLPRELLGKTLSGVVLREATDAHTTPATCLFLLFEDGTAYEFYSHDGSISPTGGLVEAKVEDVEHYFQDEMKTVKKVV